MGIFDIFKKKQKNKVSKDDGLTIGIDKKTGKLTYEGNNTLFDNSAVHAVLSDQFPKDLTKSTDATVNIVTCIKIFNQLFFKKSTDKNIVKQLDTYIAPWIKHNLKGKKKTSDLYKLLLNSESLNENLKIDTLHQWYKDIDGYYFDAESPVTGRLNATALMLYTISLGGCTFKDKKKDAQKIWNKIRKVIKKCKNFNEVLIPKPF